MLIILNTYNPCILDKYIQNIAANANTNPAPFASDKLIKLYGGEDNNPAIAVSYAIENWAPAGFWKDLIKGLRNYNLNADIKLPLSYFTWHDKIEDQHAEHTQEELEELYFTKDLNENNFIKDGNEMLDALLIFLNGLKI